MARSCLLVLVNDKLLVLESAVLDENRDEMKMRAQNYLLLGGKRFEP